jgi:hypothetical protein
VIILIFRSIISTSLVVVGCKELLLPIVTQAYPRILAFSNSNSVGRDLTGDAICFLLRDGRTLNPLLLPLGRTSPAQGSDVGMAVT